MGADTKKLRNRIKSVNSTLHLTKAMGLVASSKLYRATANMNKSREYANAVRDIVGTLSLSSECQKSPFMQKHEGERLKLIVIAGDRGLAGGYNANIFRLMKEYPDADICAIGRRACTRYSKEEVSVETFSSADAVELSHKLCEEFKNNEFDKLGIVSTKYKSMLTQTAELEWILPIEKKEEAKPMSILFEPNEETVLNDAVPRYVAGILMSSVKESFACEVAARRTAMDSAGKNAQQMIDDLQLTYNMARQSAITQEITEIVAGSDV